MIQFSCPNCKKVLKAPAERVGAAVRCPQCKQQLTVPSPAPEKSAANIGEADKLVAPPPPPPPPVPTAEQWYFTRNGERQGPVTTEQLQRLAASSQLQPTDMVWKQGMAQWIQASTISNLFDQVSPPPLSVVPEGRPPAVPGAVAVSAADSPIGLKAPVIAVLVVSGLALAFGVIGLLLPDVDTGTKVLSGLALAHNIATLTLTLNIIRLRNYGLCQVTPWLVMTCWTWHWLTNPIHGMTLLGMILAASVGVWCLLVLRRPTIRAAFDADPPLPSLFSLGQWWLKQSLLGKWIAADNDNEQLEFTVNTITLGNSLRGRPYTVLGNSQIEISCSDSEVQTWTVIKADTAELLIKNHRGETKCYKRQNPLKSLAAFFTTSRMDMLVDTWMPADGNGHWIQFTKDGAFVCGDQSAGRFTLAGEEPNEIIRITMTDNTIKEWKVVSLSLSQLVVADGPTTRIYHQHRPHRAKTGSSAATPGDNQKGNESSSSAGRSGKGFFGSLFSWFTRYKCPKCNQRSGKSLSTTLLERTQEVMSLPEGNTFVQRVVNVSTWQDHVKCQDCGHEWYERSRTRTKA